MGWIKKKDLLKKIETLETRVNGLQSSNKTLLDMITKMNEKVTYLWNQDQYKKDDMDSILDEWMNGAKKEGDD